MNSGLTLAILSLFGVIVAPTLGYLIAKRKSSGTIDTTEAETLWQQSNALLDRYKADLEATRAKVVTLEARVETLQSLIQTLESKALEAARKLADEAAVRLAVSAAEVLAQPATGTPADKKARDEALAVARTLALKVKAETEERKE